MARIAFGREAWVGGTRTCKYCSTWIWVDGTRFSFSSWDNGQPDNAGGLQDALVVNWLNRFGRWDDDSSNEKRLPFVCEYN